MKKCEIPTFQERRNRIRSVEDFHAELSDAITVRDKFVAKIPTTSHARDDEPFQGTAGDLILALHRAATAAAPAITAAKCLSDCSETIITNLLLGMPLDLDVLSLELQERQPMVE